MRGAGLTEARFVLLNRHARTSVPSGTGITPENPHPVSRNIKCCVTAPEFKGFDLSPDLETDIELNSIRFQTK
jgi:hypothetical protein